MNDVVAPRTTFAADNPVDRLMHFQMLTHAASDMKTRARVT
ncbi:hypothetical protein JL2886_01094 [Phaeobacter gallaeciensis]|uniref:Uncharacterized protein n=1 Tax=Phaeobacter gallaeciensis TaxID=60890 RepID=A0A1B0ZPE2_9RHOB|nr:MULTISPECIES: hypothetical protein [Phaeobacter]MDF1770707.1 hypothetical protein [Pseudophaeobacter sp. bin_em_oilr2.035]ANP36015.1 hypothetical protein JL2886_01094 [Phaeobacter gallaeciensis]MDE4146694.1 hypothetical protein [Phaeobacter gallaeciensis]MDE4159367.1 hypothetical protein [Phaeobacter gallaeciensis]MDE4163518.1 hypothetical protein [Phaeobacter gallaeciensis]